MFSSIILSILLRFLQTFMILFHFEPGPHKFSKSHIGSFIKAGSFDQPSFYMQKLITSIIACLMAKDSIIIFITVVSYIFPNMHRILSMIYLPSYVGTVILLCFQTIWVITCLRFVLTMRWTSAMLIHILIWSIWIIYDMHGLLKYGISEIKPNKRVFKWLIELLCIVKLVFKLGILLYWAFVFIHHQKSFNSLTSEAFYPRGKMTNRYEWAFRWNRERDYLVISFYTTNELHMQELIILVYWGRKVRLWLWPMTNVGKIDGFLHQIIRKAALFVTKTGSNRSKDTVINSFICYLPWVWCEAVIVKWDYGECFTLYCTIVHHDLLGYRGFYLSRSWSYFGFLIKTPSERSVAITFSSERSFPRPCSFLSSISIFKSIIGCFLKLSILTWDNLLYCMPIYGNGNSNKGKLYFCKGISCEGHFEREDESEGDSNDAAASEVSPVRRSFINYMEGSADNRNVNVFNG